MIIKMEKVAYLFMSLSLCVKSNFVDIYVNVLCPTYKAVSNITAALD